MYGKEEYKRGGYSPMKETVSTTEGFSGSLSLEIELRPACSVHMESALHLHPSNLPLGSSATSPHFHNDMGRSIAGVLMDDVSNDYIAPL